MEKRPEGQLDGHLEKQLDGRLERRIAHAAVAGALLLSGLACDNEDQRDVEEGVNQIEKGAEDVVDDADKELDKLDSDGKDD